MSAGLEQAARRFVDLVMAGDLSAAQQAFVDAQAVRLDEARVSAHLWVARERQAAQQLPDTVGEDHGARLLAAARRVRA